MKEFKFIKDNVSGIFRVVGRYLFFKYSNTEQSKMIINEFMKKGINIQEGRGWIRVDLIGKNDNIKIGDYEISTDETLEEIENKFYSFYTEQYRKLGFKVETQDEKPN
jgi:hypothetical protein